MKTNKYEYRDVRGVTRFSVAAVRKHLSKLGKLHYVRGIFSGKCNGIANPWYRVVIAGETGTMILGGLSWGYNGEGSRGLEEVLRMLPSISEQPIEIGAITQRSANSDLDMKVGAVNGVKEIWRYDFNSRCLSGTFRSIFGN